MVRTETGSGPLFCSRLPVSGCFGGGESRLLGLEAELDSGLIGGLAEVGQEIADLLLAGVDDLAGWGLVDGIGHPPAELLELLAPLLHEGLGGDLRWALHGSFLGVGLVEANGPPGPLAVHRLRYAFPEDLPRPERLEPVSVELIERVIAECKPSEKVTVEITVRVTGEVFPGGLLNQQLVQIAVEAEATHLPDGIDVNI